MTSSPSLRDFIKSKLAERGQALVGDHDSLFTSGRLDSLAAVEVMMILEGTLGLDLSDADFDIAKLDTLAELDALVASLNKAA